MRTSLLSSSPSAATALPLPFTLGSRFPAVALTPAEERVLHLVQLGLSNKEIALACGRAEPTIKNQVAACLRKYRVSSRSRLIALLH